MRVCKEGLKYVPIVMILSFFIVAADRTGKLGIFGTLITLMIDPQNFALKYDIQLKKSVQRKVYYFRDISLSLYCSWYATYIVNRLIQNRYTLWIDLVLPSCFFLLIWCHLRYLVPKTMHYLNEKN